MKDIQWNVISAFGLDYNRQNGRINTASTEWIESFQEYWWKETCAFERFLVNIFGPAAIFVSDHVPTFKSFGIELGKSPSLKSIAEACLQYLRQFHPDASVSIVFGEHAGSPVTCELVVSSKAFWIERDLVYWLLQMVDQEDYNLPNVDVLELSVQLIDIKNRLNWLSEYDSIFEQPQSFWNRVYGERRASEKKPSAKESDRVYQIGSRIIDNLSRKFWMLDENYYCDIYFPRLQAANRMVNIECATARCDPNLFKDVLNTVRSVDDSWAVRFAIYEDLVKENSYVGRILAVPGMPLILESGNCSETQR